MWGLLLYDFTSLKTFTDCRLSSVHLWQKKFQPCKTSIKLTTISSFADHRKFSNNKELYEFRSRD
jgi:hypothetical protein